MYDQLLHVAKEQTSDADVVLDDEGKPVDEPIDAEDFSGKVLIVDPSDNLHGLLKNGSNGTPREGASEITDNAKSNGKGPRHVAGHCRLGLTGSREQTSGSQRRNTMAKKKKKRVAVGTARRKRPSSPATPSRPRGPLPPRDRKTMDGLVRLADNVAVSAERQREPFVDVPSRTLSNVQYSPSKGILEMGDSKNRRQLFNLTQAKSYMQTMLVASGCKDLIDAQKTTSIRGLYYSVKHTIEGTKEETFNDQGECDPIIEDLEVILNSLREELHLFAKMKGNMVGHIELVDKGDPINCARMGSGGYGIPSIVEPEVIQFKKCSAKFVLHVEKETVWARFNEDRFWDKYKCILTHSGGQATRGVRRLLYRLNKELKLPIYVLADNDPWGYYIYSVIKQGSINLAFESRRMAVPDAKYLGIRSKDFERCGLNESAIIRLNENDRKRANQIKKYPWFAKKKAWQKEIDLMLKNDLKLEVEALTQRGVSYVTEEYLPQRLKDRDWLD